MPAAAASVRTLSKSDYKLARSCEAKLYFRENRYVGHKDSDPYLKLLFLGTFMVESLAEAKRPDGIHCEYGRDAAADSVRTLELLQQDRVTLFQGTLLWGRRQSRFDILEKEGSRIRLIEVKAGSIDGAAHKKSLEEGGVGVLRTKKKPHSVMSDWLDYVEDVAFQKLVLNGVMPDVTVESFLALVDTSKRSKLDNVPQFFEISHDDGANGFRRASARFVGNPQQLVELDLLAEIDVSQEVATVEEFVNGRAAEFESLLESDWSPSTAAHGASCIKCEFNPGEVDDSSGFAKCWGALADTRPHMLELANIGKVKDADGTPIVTTLFNDGRSSLFDIPEGLLKTRDGSIGPQAEQQLRQIAHTRSGESWIGPNLKANVEGIRYPVHFIDFEASRLALPYHANMRPYGQVAFQWSCHTIASPGATPVHTEWLNTSEFWPNGEFVRELRKAIGDSDCVVTWSPFEGSALKGIAQEIALFESSDPELKAWIENVVSTRIVDLHKWAKNDFYHPGMKGRTSIKVVMDALWKSDITMRDQFTSWTGMPASESMDPYHALPALKINGVEQDVREGTGAISAYDAMMYGVEKGDQAAKDAWSQLLKEYCKLDTLSMVLVFEYWKRVVVD